MNENIPAPKNLHDRETLDDAALGRWISQRPVPVGIFGVVNLRRARDVTTSADRPGNPPGKSCYPLKENMNLEGYPKFIYFATKNPRNQPKQTDTSSNSTSTLMLSLFLVVQISSIRHHVSQKINPA